MKILIIEDEHYAAKRLTNMVNRILLDATILEPIDSVEESINWFANNEEPDLIFMDIQLADGLSFKIFEAIKFTCPVIFITAFDEFAIEAFKLNSVDYLLKPIEEDKLKLAIEKFKKYHRNSSVPNIDWQELSRSLYANKEAYKKRFLIKTGAAFQYLNTSDIALIYSEESISFAINKTGKRLIVDNTLDKIETSLDPTQFFRISRKHIVSVSEINKIHPHLNSRLKLDINQKTDQNLVVSREKVKDFKHWIEG